MRVLVLSDVHANLSALQAVLEDAPEGIANMWVLGDTIGYGAEPNECLDVMRQEAAFAVAGNHEEAAVGDIPTSEFNPYAKVAIEWTAQALTEANRDYLWGLPLREEQEVFTMVHGSPRNPVWEYLTTEDAAIENLTHFSTRGCLIGHTHVPFLASVENGESVKLTAARPGRPIAISGQRFYLNPGSVGQPRDGDPRASYALLDTEEMTVEFRRVSYDIPSAQRSIRAAGLPDMLAERLSQGR